MSECKCQLRVCKCCELTGRPEFGHVGDFCEVCDCNEPLELSYLRRISEVLDMLPAFAVQVEEMRDRLRGEPTASFAGEPYDDFTKGEKPEPFTMAPSKAYNPCDDAEYIASFGPSPTTNSNESDDETE